MFCNSLRFHVGSQVGEAYRPEIKIHFRSFQSEVSLHIVMQFLRLVLVQILLS
jgi:hypothetical protein